MSDLMDINLDEFEPAQLLDDGNYSCKVVYAGMRRSTKETQRPYLSLLFEATEVEDAEGFNGLLSFPIDSDEKRTVRLMQKNLVEFCEAFGLDKGEFMTSCKEALNDLDAGNDKARVEFIEGSEGIVKVSTQESQEGVEQNYAKAYIK